MQLSENNNFNNLNNNNNNNSTINNNLNSILLNNTDLKPTTTNLNNNFNNNNNNNTINSNNTINNNLNNNNNKINTNWEQLNKFKFYSIGLIASYSSRLIFFPLEVIKTFQQVNTNKESLQNIYKNIYNRNGLKGFYKGYFTMATGKCFIQFVYLSSYEFINQSLLSLQKNNTLQQNNNLTTFQRHAISGLIAELCCNLFVVPFDVTTQRLMISNSYLSTHPINTTTGTGIATTTGIATDIVNNKIRTRDVMKTIYKTDGGIKGFYKGIIPTLLIYAPESAIWWGIFGSSKEKIANLLQPLFINNNYPNLNYPNIDNIDKNNNFYLMTMSTSLAGALSGFSCALLFNPLDVIKTRIQTNYKLLNIHSVEEHYSINNNNNTINGNLNNIINGNNTINSSVKGSSSTSMIEVGKELIRKEGWKGFTKGLLPKTLYNSGMSMVSLTMYEIVKWISRKE
ncbi:hypothetical protein ABK040_010733 [Willaertia magna]